MDLDEIERLAAMAREAAKQAVYGSSRQLLFRRAEALESVSTLIAERNKAMAEAHKATTSLRLIADTARSLGFNNRRQESNAEMIGRALRQRHEIPNRAAMLRAICGEDCRCTEPRTSCGNYRWSAPFVVDEVRKLMGLGDA